MLRRRPGGLPYPQADLGAGISSQGAATAGVPLAEYTFGAHQDTIYNAEAIKSQTRRAVVAGVTAAIGAYLYAPQQVYADVQPVFVQPNIAGHTPSQSTFQYATPQLVDLTLQASIQPALRQGATPALGGFQYATPQAADLTLQASVQHPISRGATPSQSTFQYATPQVVDLTQQSAMVRPSIAPLVVTGPVASFISIGPQIEDRPTSSILPAQQAGHTPVIGAFVYGMQPAFDYYIPARIFTPTFGPQGWIIPQQIAEPQDTYQPAPQWSLPSTGILSTGKLGTYALTLPQDQTQLSPQYSIPIVGTPLVSGILGAFAYAAPQQVDLTLPASVTRPTIGPYVPLISQFAAPQQVDLTLPAAMSRSVIGPSLPQISQFAAPQQVDLTLAAQIVPASSVPLVITGPTVRPSPAVPPQPDLNVNYSAMFTYVPTISPSAPAPTVLYRVGGPRTGDPGVHERDSTRVGTSTTSRNLQ